MEFLNEYHLAGLFIGICTFLIIGLFHPVVVKAEYYWGTKCWWIFLILGIAGVAASLSVDNVILSSLLGVFAFSSFWTIKEVFEQEDRVKKGWFPKNPKPADVLLGGGVFQNPLPQVRHRPAFDAAVDGLVDAVLVQAGVLGFRRDLQ